MNSSLIFDASDPVCFLPPELAFQAMISRYIFVGTLGALIWEILNSISDDYKLLFKHRVKLPTVVYLISKLSSLGFVTATTVYETRPVQNHDCRWLHNLKGLDALLFLAALSTSLLFFFRIRAIFNKNPWVVAFFAGLWLAIGAACLISFVGFHGVDIGPTEYCTIRQIKPFATATAIIPLINDTLVFLAITWRLSRNSYAQSTLKNGIRALVFGDSLPAFSKAMLQDGQAYYLASVTINLIASIMLCNRSGPELLRTIFAVPNVALTNVMACRVYRNTKLRNSREAEMSGSFISRELNFAHSSNIIPLSLGEVESGGRMKQVEDVDFKECTVEAL